MIELSSNDLEDNNNNVSQDKLKILFYHASPKILLGESWMSPAVLWLKTHIDLHHPELAKRLEWLIPIQDEITDDELISYIEKNDVDILGTSHYLWNNKILFDQLQNIKNKIDPKVKIVVGGPSIDVNIDKEFFNKYHYVDYAVYNAGEKAFADILHHLVFKKPLIAFNTSNCAWRDRAGKTIVADYKFVQISQTSPFLHCKKMLEDMVEEFKKHHKIEDMWFSYTLTRGCPYACTFCDWNSGLGNKVSRRKNTYQQEIDLFQELGIKNIYLADANVGQYAEDVDMIEYFAQKNAKENCKFKLEGNFSKLKKDNNLKIFHMLLKYELAHNVIFAVQDINPEVLENIDRPDVGWEVHYAMIKELQDAYPDRAGLLRMQLIYGLPGQTVETWRHTLREVAKSNVVPVCFFNDPLPASPALIDPAYQDKFQFEYALSNRMSSQNTEDSRSFLGMVPTRCISFTQADLVSMNLLSTIYRCGVIINVVLKKLNVETFDIESLVDDFLTSSNYQNFYQNLFYNWTVENNYYYTIQFDGTYKIIPEHELWYFLLRDKSFLKYVIKFLPPNSKKSFMGSILNNPEFHGYFN